MDNGMISAIIVAGLSLVGTLAGSWMGVKQSNKLVNWRIDRLEEKVDAHNHMAERLAVAERDLKTTNKRLDQLEREMQE